ncbi:hypothetical protein NVP2117O_39 [Vibrio phage 2.117.O._10N.261.45.E9]|nr:hypothetical protein NVP1117O_39 [Vibrio phage 1.117.O._10N.261.45.E9]AUR95440.1 hypothetical protein NVP1207B_33 [Vibrio phage 1.207.B._10N.222.51.C2]AUS02331.1 hypothetical protein NVP2117O_39 [Vibrio phage 2.117.O._10N.261.45.E9]
MTGQRPKELAEHLDTPPPSMKYVWDWYIDLHSGVPLSYTELEAWCRMTGRDLLSWEVDLLRALDRLYWRQQHD